MANSNKISIAPVEGDETVGDFLNSLDRHEDVQDAIEAVRLYFGLKHATFHLVTSKSGSIGAPFVKTTYPCAWVARYLTRGYADVDPVAREGFQRVFPFDWAEVQWDGTSLAFMQDAARHDLGTNGYSIPTVDRAGYRSLLSFTSDLALADWNRLISSHRELLSEVAHGIHRKALREVSGKAGPMPALGPRELECLTWTARGKDYLAIAQILGISGHTVRGYLKSSRFKLECGTLPQAVAKALALQLIVQ